MRKVLLVLTILWFPVGSAKCQEVLKQYPVMNMNEVTILTLDAIQPIPNSNMAIGTLFNVFEGFFSNDQVMDIFDLPAFFKSGTFLSKLTNTTVQWQETGLGFSVIITSADTVLKSDFTISKSLNGNQKTVKVSIARVSKTIKSQTTTTTTVKTISGDVLIFTYTNGSTFTPCQIAFAVLANLSDTDVVLPGLE